MDAEETEALGKLTKSILELKELKTQQGEQVAGLIAAQEQIKRDFTAVQQLLHARTVGAQEAQLGTNRELDGYLVRSLDGIDSTARSSLHTPSGGTEPAVRLRGHFTSRTQGSDVYPVWNWGLLDDPNPRSKDQLALQRSVSRRNLARMHCAEKKRFSPQLDREVMEAVARCGGTIERIFADSTNIGGEWIPTTLVPELERQILVPTNLAALFKRRILQPGTTQIPRRTGNIRVYKGAIPTTDNPAAAILSSLGTDNQSVDPVPSYASSQVDRDALADSLVPIIDELMMEIAMAFRFADDDCIINGDTTATHQDAIATWNTRNRLGGTVGLGTIADHRRRWMGLRPRAYDLTSMTTDQNAAQTYAGLKVALGKLSPDSMINGNAMGNTVVVLVSWEYFFGKMVDFTEFISWDKVGDLASILTGMIGDVGRTPGGMLPGQVGFLQGMIPVCIAYPLTADLAATGLYTGAGTTTGMLQCDRSRFEYCFRQGVVVESDTEIRNNTTTYVARSRVNFRPLDPVSSTIKDVHYSFNITG